ncbi:unnamed protein product [Brassicogethes aeneus]|uniref:Peptidase aspartic putative domain-containing protein n=1 Tax=Brassicogethes aeneus TaxID=1431903 RepID=A0A9P0B7W1_BRAAE|nr:unnamed protein product [Brassicogethes aeneus]
MRIQFNKIKINNNAVSRASVFNDKPSTTVSEVGLNNETTKQTFVDYNKQITNLLQFIKVEVDSIEQAQDATGSDQKEKHFTKVPEICFESLEPPSLNDPIIYNFSMNYQLADNNAAHRPTNGITLLVGADNYWKIITGETQRLSEKLTAVNSQLGWTLHGPSNNETYNYNVNFSLATVLQVHAVCEDIDIKHFWDLETIGINASEKQSDNFTENFISEQITLKNGRYEVSLPWESNKKLDSNFSGALMQLRSLTAKLCKNGKLNEYDRVMREYLKNDCADRVQKNTTNERVYYMPHRPVYRDDKETTKVRIVVNASSHAPGFPSLNELLLSGDNLVPDIIRILMNFRVGSVGLIADIEKAFLQISLAEEDRDSHRFLWYDDPIKTGIT